MHESNCARALVAGGSSEIGLPTANLLGDRMFSLGAPCGALAWWAIFKRPNLDKKKGAPPKAFESDTGKRRCLCGSEVAMRRFNNGRKHKKNIGRRAGHLRPSLAKLGDSHQGAGFGLESPVRFRLDR
jgi:hypothetical protein